VRPNPLGRPLLSAENVDISAKLTQQILVSSNGVGKNNEPFGGSVVTLNECSGMGVERQVSATAVDEDVPPSVEGVVPFDTPVRNSEAFETLIGGQCDRRVPGIAWIRAVQHFRAGKRSKELMETI
jgi:hypothetical protein